MDCYIYGLSSSEDGVIRYVGKTKSPLKQRKNEHKCDAITKKFRNHKCNWIRNVISKGYDIVIEEIEKCTEENWENREKYWISTLKEKNNLVNELKGGQSGGVGGKIRNYISYDEAKCFLQNLTIKLKTYADYKKYYNEHIDDIKDILPKSPQRVYKFRGTWKGWGDFLGDDTYSALKKHFMFPSFENFVKILKENNISTKKKYKHFVKNNDILLPINPSTAYKDEWKGWGYLKDEPELIDNYDDFLKYMRENYPSVISSAQYRRLFKGEKLPIPYHPERKYKINWEKIKKDLL